MRITYFKVENYRGLRDIEIPMSRFGCLIGENNSGKSSVLQTLSLFFSGSSLSGMNFFDESEQIRIEMTLSDISDEDTASLVDEHRPRIQSIIKNGSLSLVRVYETDGKSTLKYRKLVPTDKRFSSEEIDSLLKGQRASQAFVGRVLSRFPELNEQINATMNQGNMREKIEILAESLPDDQKVLADLPLPTGIDRSISAMLPEPIYIPAVKDLADDIKTKEGSTFGKVLGILLKAIEPSLAEEKELFARLESKLNRVILPDGTFQDNRLPEVKIIEKTVEKYVQESFSNVTINVRIPPPELKTVLSSAQIYANDGVEGPIESKGDGLRRAVVFAILRSYVNLRRRKDLTLDVAEESRNRYLLLFEEPELYLYPQAQQILFEALSVFSQRNSVVVTTHSPIFFGPEATATFIKLRKVFDTKVAPRPYTFVHTVDLSDICAKDQFQIVCYENNNAAFFADTVVLVEGDSDYLVLPHLAMVINPEWDCANSCVEFARINGKTSIKRYKEFFKRFNARVVVVSDLDILVNGFEQLEPNKDLKRAQSSLIQRVDEVILASCSPEKTSAGETKGLHEKGELRSLWARTKKALEDYKSGSGAIDNVEAAVDQFFAYERKNDRLEVMKHTQEKDIIDLKNNLLVELRKQDVFVLEKGDIEDYYPEDVGGSDKPSKAQSFCSNVTSKELALSLCNDVVDIDGKLRKELEVIFKAVFRNSG